MEGEGNRQCARRHFGAPFAVTLTMCVTVKANALKEERVLGRVFRADLVTCALALFVASVIVGDKDSKTRKTHWEEALVAMSMDTQHARRRCSGP